MKKYSPELLLLLGVLAFMFTACFFFVKEKNLQEVCVPIGCEIKSANVAWIDTLTASNGYRYCRIHYYGK